MQWHPSLSNCSVLPLQPRQLRPGLLYLHLMLLSANQICFGILGPITPVAFLRWL